MTSHATQVERASPLEPAAEPVAILREFVAELLKRFRRLSRDAFADGAAQDRLLDSLLLADAALRHADARLRRPIPHLAVIGPTQVGKSTVVNLLSAEPAAGVSPLAGFTVHPQAFAIGTPPPDADADALLGGAFADWRRCDPGELSRDDLACFGFRALPPRAAGPIPTVRDDAPPVRILSAEPRLFDEPRPPPDDAPGDELPPCVLWDTPDFDSLASRSYQRGVLEAAALADALLLVVSKEKYADLTVWKLLEMLRPLDRPVVLCANKMTPDAEAPIVAALTDSLRRLEGDSPATRLVTLPHDAELTRPGPAQRHPAVQRLRREVGRALEHAAGKDRRAGVRALLRARWDEWCAPLRAEHDAANQWRKLVAAGLAQLQEGFRRDFLDNPGRFDTFRRTIAELLQLLEIPGVARVMTNIRGVLTLPGRWLYQRGAALWRSRRGPGRPAPLPDAASEELVLLEQIEKLLVMLEREASHRDSPDVAAHAVWRALRRRMQEQSSALRQGTAEAVRRHHDAFMPEIRSAAGRLLDSLRENPRLLNSLRAARATADAAGILLAVKSAGLPINELLLAPAMLALTSMLAEGALGTYMLRVCAELKERQAEHLKRELCEAFLRPRLEALVERLDADGLLAVTEPQLARAEAALTAWEVESHV
ncbi:MAG: 50S ribosome-binding GTPase [Phycisphaerae bacterium]